MFLVLCVFSLAPNIWALLENSHNYICLCWLACAKVIYLLHLKFFCNFLIKRNHIINQLGLALGVSFQNFAWPTIHFSRCFFCESFIIYLILLDVSTTIKPRVGTFTNTTRSATPEKLLHHDDRTINNIHSLMRHYYYYYYYYYLPNTLQKWYP